MNGYLIKISMGRNLIDELAISEEAHYEDRENAAGIDLTLEIMDAGKCEKLAYLILQRFKTIIAIQDKAEAEEIYWAVSSGTFQIDHFRSACKIADALRPLVSERTARTYYPYGA